LAYLKKPAEQKRRDSGAANDYRHAGGNVHRGHTPSSNPPAPPSDKRLVDILSSAIAEHDQEMITHGEIERLQFFRRTLQRLSAMMAPASEVFQRHSKARGRFQSIVDATSALRALFVERCPQFVNTADDSSQLRFDDEGATTLTLMQRLLADNSDEGETLDMELDGVLFEVAGMRDVLSRDHALAALLQMDMGSISDTVRQELSGINVALTRLLQSLTEALGLPAAPLTAPRAPARPAAAQFPGVPVAPQPSATPRPDLGRAPFTAPAAPASMPPIPPWAPQSTPLPVTPAPAIASEATGLVLSAADDDFPVKSSEPDVAHRSEEEGIKALQAFFESHSPEGTLLKAHDEEFANLVGRLLRYICPETTFSQNDMTIRLRQLKDTLALRKKLHNTMTLAEFKAYFRKTR
jgi:hypothetical protein